MHMVIISFSTIDEFVGRLHPIVVHIRTLCGRFHHDRDIIRSIHEPYHACFSEKDWWWTYNEWY